MTWQAELKAQVNQAFSEAQPGPPPPATSLLTGNTRLAVPIFQSLNFTITYDTFMRLARGNELGVSHDLTLGLAWTWGRAVQTFRLSRPALRPPPLRLPPALHPVEESSPWHRMRFSNFGGIHQFV